MAILSILKDNTCYAAMLLNLYSNCSRAVCVLSVYRRLTSNNAANSHVERAPNTYEMSSGESSQPTYSTIYDQPEARAPATSTSTKPVVTNTAENDGTQPSAPSPQISSHTDTTLIDNDLYQ